MSHWIACLCGQRTSESTNVLLRQFHRIYWKQFIGKVRSKRRWNTTWTMILLVIWRELSIWEISIIECEAEVFDNRSGGKSGIRYVVNGKMLDLKICWTKIASDKTSAYSKNRTREKLWKYVLDYSIRCVSNRHCWTATFTATQCK